MMSAQVEASRSAAEVLQREAFAQKEMDSLRSEVALSRASVRRKGSGDCCLPQMPIDLLRAALPAVVGQTINTTTPSASLSPDQPEEEGGDKVAPKPIWCRGRRRISFV